MPKNRTTRRKGRGCSVMSVEGLHASFERIDKKARTQILKGATDSALATCLRHAWSEQFHTSLSGAALKGLVGHYRKMFGSKVRKTRRRQRGGMAPMDWTLGQGITNPVFGKFPVEMGTYEGAVRSLDRYYENPISSSCDKQTGGGLLDALGMGYTPNSVPNTSITGALSAVQGRAVLNPPADPAVPRVQMSTFTPQPFPVPSHSISSVSSIYGAY